MKKSVARGRGRALQHAVPVTSQSIDYTRSGSLESLYSIDTSSDTSIAAISNKKGTSGVEVTLGANYLKLATIPNWTLYQYHTSFQPEENRIDIKRQLLSIYANELGGYWFDGTFIYCRQRLESPLTMVLKTATAETIKIIITFIREIFPGDYESLQFFNVMMRKCLMKLVGRNKFDSAVKINLMQHNKEIWPGYITSIRQHENDILMCIEIAHKVMRTDTVLEILKGISKYVSDVKNQFKAKIVGTVVLTDYNNKTYRIYDVDFNANPLSKFTCKNGLKLSYFDYYKQRYNIRIKDTKQPLLITKSNARDLRTGLPETIYLIPELCRMTGTNDEMRGNYKLISEMAVHTRLNPALRIKKTQDLISRICSEPEIVYELRSWNIKLSPNLINFHGRELPLETIIQGPSDKRIEYKAPNGLDWTYDAHNTEMFSSAYLSNWIVLLPNKMSSITEKFIQILVRRGRKMGMKMEFPQLFGINDDKPSTYVNKLEEILKKNNPQIVICCVPNNCADRYGAIKKTLCVDRAVPSQVITDSAMNTEGIHLQLVAAKVAVQINCKIGGAPWGVEIPRTFPFYGVMIVGFDVTHDSMCRGISYGAMVATTNNTFTRYFSTVSAHKSGEELGDQISFNLIEALDNYEKYNKTLPTRIIIYRDGVEDSQIPSVKSHEIGLIKAKLYQEYGDKTWDLTYIVVSKRINTRILDIKNKTNPRPGTVVDDCITIPDRYDFFLVSQSVWEGTVSPSYYNVIVDNSNLSPDMIQRLTYKLCHLYYNWSGTIRVPAPVQYAHKLAELVGQHLHCLPNADVRTSSFFIKSFLYN